MLTDSDKKLIEESLTSTKQITVGEMMACINYFIFHPKISLIETQEWSEEEKKVLRMFSMNLVMSVAATMLHGDDENYRPDSKAKVTIQDNEGNELKDTKEMA